MSKSSGNFIDMTGRKFGRLTVLRRSGSTAQGVATWLCKCRCGSEAEIAGTLLRKGHTRSCGCLLQEHYLKQRNKGLKYIRGGGTVEDLEDLVRGA